MTLPEFVMFHTVRGECNCGKCFDRGSAPDPMGHTANTSFFKVALANGPTKDEFLSLTKSHRGEFNEVDVLDGKEHNYIELGGWIGDQGVALQFMGMGALLGVFSLMTPESMFGSAIDEETAKMMAGMGMVAVQVKK